MFKVALFINTIAKTQKQPKCPSTNEWIKEIWCVYVCIYIHIHTHTHTHTYIHTMEYYSAMKKPQNNAICSNMDGPTDYHIK